MAVIEEECPVVHSVRKPEFIDILRRATGRTLHVPTLAERLRRHGGSIVFSNASPGAAYFQDPDGYGSVFHSAGSYKRGREAVGIDEQLDIRDGEEGDRIMTDRFLRIVESGELPALSVVWLSEPDWTAHQSPLGSEQHLAAIRSADENVGRIIEGLKRNKLWNEEILVVVCSDHGNETVRREIDVVGELVAAGLKRDRVSADIVMASQGTAGYIYFGPGCAEVERVASYLLRQDWVGDVFVGDDIEEIGLSRDNGLEVVFSMAASAETNEYGIPGSADLAIDPDISVSFLGYAHHGGLGRSEQAPFLMIAGAGFAEGSVSAARASPLDIAPTILRHHSMPCDGMDGRPLQNEMRSVR